MSADAPDTDDAPMSTRAKVIAAAVVLVLLTGAAVFLMRLESPAIGPAQTPPAGHYALPCWLCHAVDQNEGMEPTP